jgi:hypothetical protein
VGVCRFSTLAAVNSRVLRVHPYETSNKVVSNHDDLEI